jgi:hypothetical protein
MTQTPRSQDKAIDARTLVKALYWLVILAAIWFAFLNVQPYAIAVKNVMEGAIRDASFLKFIASLPIINAIAFVFGIVLHWFIGFLLWIVVQTIEVLPIILKHDRAFVRTLINTSEQTQRFEIKDNDDPALKALKRWYNAFPALTLSRARTVSLFMYAIDFCICIVVYPPCPGGFRQLMFLLFTGQFSQLNWRNITLLLITLFVIEAIVHFLLWLGKVAYFMREAHSHS